MKKQILAGSALAASASMLLTGCGAGPLRDAKIGVEQGPLEQIFGEPQEERAREFLGQIIAAGRL
ncbi:MAG: hypothetical protein QM606_00480 [Leucobacter sp.]